MRLTILKSVVTIFAFSAVGVWSAKADTVVGGTWTTWDQNTLNNPGTGAYWNNPDPGDGGNANVGWCLAGGGNCTIPNPPGFIPFLSNGSGGGAPANFRLTNSGTGTAGELLVSITNNSSHDLFGWYNTSNPSVLFPLFNGTQSNTTTIFMPSASYGFYLTDQLGTFFTQTKYDTTKDGFQAFAIFMQSVNNSYFLGVEDGGGGGDRDYNDMVIQLTSVPEPASVALLGGSLVLMGAFIRRRKRTIE